jgi:hypothetical protein
VGIPDEDRGPAWLRDWKQIEADITAMADFAAKLLDEVTSNYARHAQKVYDDMLIVLPPANFAELLEFLEVHHTSQQAAADNVYEYANATSRMAYAAAQISKQYAQSDAFAHARVTDVERELMDAGVFHGSTSGSGTTVEERP